MSNRNVFCMFVGHRFRKNGFTKIGVLLELMFGVCWSNDVFCCLPFFVSDSVSGKKSLRSSFSLAVILHW